MDKVKKIIAGWIIDGTGGPVYEKALLNIDNGKIKSITNTEQKDYYDHDALNLSEYTILPPLVDAHVHLAMSGTINKKNREHQLNAVYDEIKHNISNHIYSCFSHGIMAVRDGGDHYGHSLKFKKSNSNFLKNPMIIHVAGKGWYREGRYGSLVGQPVAKNESLADLILKEKYDDIQHIKIINSGLNSLSDYGKETPPQFNLIEMKEAVNAAKSLGLKVMVHANGNIPVKISVEAGCDSIEHGYFMGMKNLELMAKNNVSWIPTTTPMKAFLEQIGTSSNDGKIAELNLKHQIKQMEFAREIGVNVVAGTDSGGFGVNHGVSLIEELKIFSKAGYKINETIKCATTNAYRLLGIDLFNSLSIGNRLNFIATKGSPAELPYSLNDCSIFYNGKFPLVLNV
jgi:imidazolonepropionase-like amidohydrolase